MHPAFDTSGAPATPIWFVTPGSWEAFRRELDSGAAAYADAMGFQPKPGRHLALPAAQGGLSGILLALENADASSDPFLPGSLPGVLPPGLYRFGNAPHDTRLAALAFALGLYRFSRYRAGDEQPIRLVVPDGVDADDLSRIVEGVTLARDLINTPSNDMGPAELEDAARALAKNHGAKVSAIVGDDLLSQNFPLIHAVGRASERAPRLIDLRWGDASHPQGDAGRQGRVL